MKHFLLILLVFAAACSTPSSTDEQATSTESVVEASDEGVFFVNINDGDTLTSPFYMEMGVNGMIVEPKGPVKEGVGHHHLLINDVAFPLGKFIAADSTHIHYGGGQTSDSVNLAPGEYVLTLQFADGMHNSYGEDWSSTISVVVR